MVVLVVHFHVIKMKRKRRRRRRRGKKSHVKMLCISWRAKPGHLGIVCVCVFVELWNCYLSVYEMSCDFAKKGLKGTTHRK